jgi:uncharacterized surface protein with fasciclin (FAS1) repeats
MKSKRADKIVLSSIPTPPTASAPQPEPKPIASNGNGSDSPYLAPNDARPRVAKRTTGRPPRWQPKENILEAAAASGRFEMLGRALQTAGLTAMLSEKGPFTLFAPTDKAFAKMPSADLTALMGDRVALHQLLSYHVVPGKVRAPRNGSPRSATTLDGTALEIAVVAEDGGYRVDNSRIVKTNIHASNGVIHAIDTVLTPR